MILEKRNYWYQRFLLDLAGIYVTPYCNTQKKLVLAMRDWLATVSRRMTISNGRGIYDRFMVFRAQMRRVCRANEVDYVAMPFVELVQNLRDCLRLNDVVYVPLIDPY